VTPRFRVRYSVLAHSLREWTSTHFPVSDLAETGAHVYLWTVNKFLRDAFDVLDAWGVRFHLAMPMVKPSGFAPCCGWVFASEFCLLGFCGKPMIPFAGCGKLNWFDAGKPKHSVKPDCFYERVAAMSPEPRLDCFARTPHSGFDGWGDEFEI
jgi:N6-adenosine-specific RNA methylase IME4